MKLATHTNDAAFDRLRDEWNALVYRSQANSVFSLWEWHFHWWQSYQPGELHIVTFHDTDHQLVGLAPLFIEKHPEYGRVLRIIGSDDVTDYLDIIIDQKCIAAVQAAFVEYLVSAQDAFDMLELCNIRQDSPTYNHLPKLLEHCGFDVVTRQQEVCPIIQLPDSFEAYLDGLDSKQARELRRKLRIVDAQMGAVQWYIAGPEHNIQVEAERFIDLMRQSHPEKATFLENDQHSAFFRAIMPAMYNLGCLQLNFLTVNEEAVAAYLNFDYQGHILVYNSGLAPQRYANLSPGIVLLCYNIQHAIAQGRKTFDFLRGDENYKYRMGAKDTIIYNIRGRIMRAME
ncbi:MAG: GNAT family N-acetyltransferase [Anaerolineae bacterium]|nr:GNAT family N-acetyltransferase [Anaerolineae bacterium]MDW8173285.1 GNAT family N-acetyltransferase [Anaerolineae bacterium]